MLGNVWEWMEDAWHNSHEGADSAGKPRIGEIEANHTVRGGSWVDPVRCYRAATRDRLHYDYRNYTIGFRPMQAG